jgi:hypothetical protein
MSTNSVRLPDSLHKHNTANHSRQKSHLDEPIHRQCHGRKASALATETHLKERVELLDKHKTSYKMPIHPNDYRLYLPTPQ